MHEPRKVRIDKRFMVAIFDHPDGGGHSIRGDTPATWYVTEGFGIVLDIE